MASVELQVLQRFGADVAAAAPVLEKFRPKLLEKLARPGKKGTDFQSAAIGFICRAVGKQGLPTALARASATSVHVESARTPAEALEARRLVTGGTAAVTCLLHWHFQERAAAMGGGK